MSNTDEKKKIISTRNDGHNYPIKKLQEITYALNQAAIVAITDRTGEIIYVNELFSEISQYRVDELLGENHRIINSGYHPPEFFKNMWATIGRGNTWHGDICNRAKDGSFYWVATTIVPFLNEEGKPYQYVSIRSEITLQKKMEEKIRENAEMYRLLTENASDFIAIIDREGSFKYVSPSYENQLGFNLPKLLKRNVYSVVKKEDQEIVRNQLKFENTIQSSTGLIEFRIMNADGKVLFMETMMNVVQDSGKYHGDIVLMMRDITSRKESEMMIHDLAYNDQLTDLLNRTSFRKKLHEEIENAKKVPKKLGVIYFNMDRLRYVNDALGHEAGDYVLSVVAKRLKEILRDDDSVGRVGGDEFAYTLRGIKDSECVIEVAEKVQSFIEQPIKVAGQSYVPSTSSGIALFPEHAQDPSELIMKAEKALHTIKARGGGGYEMYKHGTAEKTLERILLENEMRKSIELGYFYLDYQPKLQLTNGELTGFEALVRWNHPDLGRIRPDKFILVAEETKLILLLGEWVMREACKQAKEWEAKGYASRIAVNISAVQMEEPTFLTTVKNILVETGISPKLLEFELTESAFADREDMEETIIAIRELGILIAIDDFGTGYSTFSYIKELPADTLKIDMSFIRDIHINKGSRAIVQAILSLAKTVDLNVVAEGIEAKEQRDILIALGCQEGQGYFYSKPMTPEACEKIMEKSMQFE